MNNKALARELLRLANKLVTSGVDPKLYDTFAKAIAMGYGKIEKGDIRRQWDNMFGLSADGLAEVASKLQAKGMLTDHIVEAKGKDEKVPEKVIQDVIQKMIQTSIGDIAKKVGKELGHKVDPGDIEGFIRQLSARVATYVEGGAEAVVTAEGLTNQLANTLENMKGYGNLGDFVERTGKNKIQLSFGAFSDTLTFELTIKQVK